MNNNSYRDEINAWLAVRKEAALHIDAATAEVDWWTVRELDPYEVDPDLAKKSLKKVPGYFACAPGSYVWIHFDDLPNEVRDALWQRVQTLMEQNLMKRPGPIVRAAVVEDDDEGNPKIQRYLAIIKREALRLDAATAEVDSWPTRTIDPYCLEDEPEILDEVGQSRLDQVGRERFARSPGSDIWVHIDDIPLPTWIALRKRLCPSSKSVSEPRHTATGTTKTYYRHSERIRQSFMPSERIKASTLFDGRLENFGFREHIDRDDTTESKRCLTDGSGYLWVHINEAGVVGSLTRYYWSGPSDQILDAIVEAFDTDWFNDPQFKSYATEEEILKFEAELVKYVRGEPNNIKKGSIDEAEAKIAKRLSEEDPALLWPEKRELFRSEIDCFIAIDGFPF